MRKLLVLLSVISSLGCSELKPLEPTKTDTGGFSYTGNITISFYVIDNETSAQVPNAQVEICDRVLAASPTTNCRRKVTNHQGVVDFTVPDGSPIQVVAWADGYHKSSPVSQVYSTDNKAYWLQLVRQ